MVCLYPIIHEVGKQTNKQTNKQRIAKQSHVNVVDVLISAIVLDC